MKSVLSIIAVDMPFWGTHKNFDGENVHDVFDYVRDIICARYTDILHAQNIHVTIPITNGTSKIEISKIDERPKKMIVKCVFSILGKIHTDEYEVHICEKRRPNMESTFARKGDQL